MHANRGLHTTRVVQGKPLRTFYAGKETTASFGEETNKLKIFSNVTYVDRVCSTFVNKGFTTESTNRMQEHWDVKLRSLKTVSRSLSHVEEQNFSSNNRSIK